VYGWNAVLEEKAGLCGAEASAPQEGADLAAHRVEALAEKEAEVFHSG
jgi:hypothetical protein